MENRMKRTAETDVAIIGGGIAGLWLLNQLREAGFSAVLLESGTLGGEQTHKAQGIIHGGAKYALQGIATGAAGAIADMPARWRACLSGKAGPDLSGVPVLSEKQYLWTTGSLVSKMAGYLAGLALRGEVRSLPREDFPDIFRHPQFKGEVYTLEEQVVDVHALIRELVKPHQDAIFRIHAPVPEDFHYDTSGELTGIDIHAAPFPSVCLRAKKYIFAAGSGNGLLLENTRHEVELQRRPLHMVMAKHDFPHMLYAHCPGASTVPRITITTHRAPDGKNIWYLGGQIAEEGITRDASQQCETARHELQTLFHWLDFRDVQFAAFRVDRVEAKQSGRKRPDSFSVSAFSNYFTVFPTKLALAPALSENILQQLLSEKIRSGKSDIRELCAFPMPPFARPMWEQLM